MPRKQYSEHIYADSDGLLKVEGLSCIDPADRFGTANQSSPRR